MLQHSRKASPVLSIHLGDSLGFQTTTKQLIKLLSTQVDPDDVLCSLHTPSLSC